jgi:hypothetical protein
MGDVQEMGTGDPGDAAVPGITITQYVPGATQVPNWVSMQLGHSTLSGEVAMFTGHDAGTSVANAGESERMWRSTCTFPSPSVSDRVIE